MALVSLGGCFGDEDNVAGQENESVSAQSEGGTPDQDQESVSEASTSQSSGTTVKVLVQPVILTSNDLVFEAVGTGRARLSVQIYPAVAEEVREVLFEAQDRVSKGEVLVLLDDREEQLAVRLAKIELKNARSL